MSLRGESGESGKGVCGEGFTEREFPKGHTLSHYLKGEGVPIQSTEKREELKQEMGAWLGGLAPWDAFATWTFSRIVTAQGAMFWAKRHITWIEKAAEQPVYGFVAAERGGSGGLIHLHALLGNVKHMQIFCGLKKKADAWKEKCCLVHAWPCGYARVYPYNPALGAKFYVSKYITKDLAEWQLFGLPIAPQTAFAHKGSEFSQTN